MSNYRVLGHKDCKFCKQAIKLLAESGESFEYLDAHKPEQKELIDGLRTRGHNTVPQIWLSGVHIGGYTDLERHFDGKFDGSQLELSISL